MVNRNRFLTRILWLLSALTLTIVLNLSTAFVEAAQQPVTLTVSSGAGLRNVMEAVQQAYAQRTPNVKINYNFAASGVLRQQIEQGAPVDVALLASQEDMDALQSQNLLLEGTRRNLLKSEVVLIVPVHSTGVSSFQDLTGDRVKRIAIGEPRTVPLGQYAEEVFNYFGIHDQVQPKLIYARSALEIMSYVESGNVDAGIVHDANAKQSNQVQIVVTAPTASHTPVIYPIAILRSSRNASAARDFIQFLSSDQATGLFQQYSYGIAQN
ncbi:MAG: molybdate ABC transporter substrate-binding protein [Cyanobacteria bacterium CRU_2_1]|nr:molybdate ABC transporter substrate-binding protein [Cyanobacteria bacterium CRU_2_1]